MPSTGSRAPTAEVAALEYVDPARLPDRVGGDVRVREGAEGGWGRTGPDSRPPPHGGDAPAQAWRPPEDGRVCYLAVPLTVLYLFSGSGGAYLSAEGKARV